MIKFTVIFLLDDHFRHSYVFNFIILQSNKAQTFRKTSRQPPPKKKTKNVFVSSTGNSRKRGCILTLNRE